MNAQDSREAALKRVQMYHFILTDAALFLDTHPTDKDALAYYGKYKKLSDDAHTDFVSRFGSLSHSDMSGDTWDWVKGPWPWEVT